MKYRIKFTLFNDKIRTCIIEANSLQDAEYRLRGKIKILSNEKVISDHDGLNVLKDMFGLK